MRLNALAHALYEPNDELDGAWSREQLLDMDARFAAALEVAFRLGLESRESARREVKLPASSAPRWVTPLCSTISDRLLRLAMDGGTVFVARG
jgi:hypothetical protein